MPARQMVPVDDNQFGIGFGEHLVGETHTDRTAADDQVVRG